MYPWIVEHLLAPVLDFWRGTKTLKCRKALEESQWWPRDRILELQNKRLRQLIRHAYQNAPYYRHLFDERGLKPGDIKGAQDLVKLPVLTKRLIKNNFDDMMARGVPRKEVVPLSTGGSTGETLKFYSTRDAYYGWGFAATQRAYGWAEHVAGDKVIELRGVQPNQPKKQEFMEKLSLFFGRILLIDTRKMSSERLLLLAGKLEGFQPALIRGYASAIYVLALLIEREGKPRLRPRAVVTCGEQLYDYQRELFGKVFGCETYDGYGAWEVKEIADECSEHSYHIAAENVIIEIADDKGEPVPVGGEGRIVVTNLHNYAMPFIRYDLGDVGALSDKVCPCGRGLPLLAKLSGRTTDLIRTRSGGVIPGMVMYSGLFPSLGIEQYQVVQETYGEAVVRVVLDREYPKGQKDEITKKIIEIYRNRIGEDLDISVEFVDQIPATEAGKRRVIISNLPARL